MNIYLSISILVLIIFKIIHSQNNDEDDNNSEEEINNMRLSNDMDKYYKYLYKKMVQNGVKTNAKPKETPLQDQLADIPSIQQNVELPGPFEPLPGRSYNNDYMPLFPFSSQYTGAFDYDPLEGKNFGGQFGVSIPSWGMMDFYGQLFRRWHDTTGSFGYLAQPVNMLGFNKNDYQKLMNNPSLLHNRDVQPTIGLGKIPRSYVPISCKAPFCNPYTSTFGVGVDFDKGGDDGFNGIFQIDVPVSKDTAYTFPLGGNVYYDFDNVTVTYGQHISPIDPYKSLLFDEPHHSRLKRNVDHDFSHNIFEKYLAYFVPKYIEIPLVYKLYPAMKPIYITSIKKNFPINNFKNKYQNFFHN
uniref:Uncharacterized protein n=1 Tax=Strongyloides papillosus TaxID=174720 RepID=A0A0N5B683_STREA